MDKLRTDSFVSRYMRSPHLEYEITELIEDEGGDSEEVEDDYVNESELFKLAKSYQLSCVIKGYPINTESLKWTFRECESYEECYDSNEIDPDELVPTDGNVNDQYHYKWDSNLEIEATKSGIYTCKVCSQFDPIQGTVPPEEMSACNETSFNFFVTDYWPGFRIDGPTETVIEEDSVTLTCAGTMYEFEQVVWYKQAPGYSAKAWERLDLKRSSARFISNEDTDFSKVSTIKFDKVRKADAGMYSCKATYINRTRGSETKEFGITVKDIVAPRKARGNNMNGTEVTIQSSGEMTMSCVTLGTPEPEVKWFKDGKLLDPNEITNSSTIDLLDNDQKLKIIFAAVHDTGTYTCTATNRGGSISSSLTVKVKQRIPLSKGLIAAIIVGLLFLLILSSVLCWKVKVYNRKYKELTRAELDLFVDGDPNSINPALGVDDQADLLPYNKDVEFPRERLKMGKQLGSGAFGRVLKAQAYGIVSWEKSTTVAVKMVKPHADITYIRALMAELKIMIHLGKHLNILNLLGACTGGLNKRELLVIVEYCRFGNIQKYLLLHRDHFISQVDPATGEANFDIGQDIIDGYGRDLPRIREDEEMSAAYRTRIPSLTTAGTGDNSPNPEGYVSMAKNGNEPNGECGRNGGSRVKPPRQQSVRYIDDPATHKVKQKRQVSIQSDYIDCDKPVNTDMTTVTDLESSTGGEEVMDNPAFERSVSHSSKTGPGWRANMRGDYDEHTIRPISTKDLICWSYQVARGMEYLASKKVMHGDLACRNILLASDNVIKICDFGLAKDIYKTNNYKKKTTGPLPIKWMAVESLTDQIFSTQSDIWSFGVVLWEMFSLGKTPYPGIEPGDRFYDKLISGYRMEKPENCPMSIYHVMMKCWEADPNSRPSFKELMDFHGDLLEDGEKNHYLDLSKRFENKHGVAGAVQNDDYLLRMNAPDYTAQTSVMPGLEEEDGYLVPEIKIKPPMAETDECGYLVPTAPLGEKGGEALEMTTLMDHKDQGNVENTVNEQNSFGHV